MPLPENTWPAADDPRRARQDHTCFYCLANTPVPKGSSTLNGTGSCNITGRLCGFGAAGGRPRSSRFKAKI